MRRLVAALPLVVGCVGPTTTTWRASDGLRDVGVVALAPPVFLADVAPSDDPLWDGTWVGDVVFSGGFIVEEHDGALQHRSTTIERGSHDDYRAAIRDVTARCLEEALGAPTRDWVPASPPDVAAPQRRNLRGSAPEDGHDTQALPRFELTPTPLAAPPTLPPGADVVLVPWIVHYYAHNGGWFLGQTYGSASGARARWLLAAYDVSGAPVAWIEVEARTETDGLYSPNRSQVEDHRIHVEQAGCDALKRRARVF